MSESPWVRIVHPDVEGEARVPRRALEHYRSAGWAPVDERRPRPRRPEPVTPAAPVEITSEEPTDG